MEQIGGFDQFKTGPITTQLEDYLANGAGDAIDQETGDPNPFQIPAEEVQSIMHEAANGNVEAITCSNACGTIDRFQTYLL